MHPPLSLLNPKNWSRSQKYIAKSDDDIANHDVGLRELSDILGESAYMMPNIVFGDMPTFPCTVRMFYTTAMCPRNDGDLNPDLEDHEPDEVLAEVWLFSDALDVSILGVSIHIDLC
jgi:hypothetical protein